MTSLDLQKHNFLIEENAQKRIENMLHDDDSAKVFRIAVNGGGCSGFQYEFSLEKTTNEDDIIFKQGNAVVAIDSISIPFIEGAKLEWIDDLIGSSFKISNPNAKSSCGCGISFSI